MGHPRISGKDLEWLKVKDDLCRSRPSCQTSMPGMYRFVLKFGAGQLLEETTSTIKAQVSSDRQLGPDMYDALSQDMKPSTADPFLIFRHAMLRLAYTGPEKVLTPSDVKRSFMKEAKVKVEAANKLMAEVKNLMSPLYVTDHSGELRLLEANFQSEIIMLALGKKHKDMDPWAESMEGAAQVLRDLVKDKSGSVITEKWAAHRPKETSSSSGPKSMGKTLPLESSIRLCFCFLCPDETPGTLLSKFETMDSLYLSLLGLMFTTIDAFEAS